MKRPPGYSTERVRAWRLANPGKNKEKRWREKGIKFTAKEYYALHAVLGGVCALCGFPPGKKALAPDHNHQTGAIRSLLCSNCNTGLGLFHDDPSLLRLAAEYVEIFSTEGV